jgi:hypothetical protein
MPTTRYATLGVSRPNPPSCQRRIAVVLAPFSPLTEWPLNWSMGLMGSCEPSATGPPDRAGVAAAGSLRLRCRSSLSLLRPLKVDVRQTPGNSRTMLGSSCTIECNGWRVFVDQCSAVGWRFFVDQCSAVQNFCEPCCQHCVLS